ncbi:MAG: transposase [bacterium]
MDKSWAGLFRKEILPELPVDKIASSFRFGFGRPTKELYAALGVLILQQMNDYSDNETVHQMAFNLQWHYALDIADESDSSKYISPKTLWNFRYIVTEKELDTVLFNQITDKLAKVFSVDTDKQRLDSVHIKSNMRRLGRISIFARSIHSFLVNLKRKHKELFKTLPTEFVERYFKKEAVNCFSMVKPSNSEKTLVSVSKDLFTLVQSFKDNEEVTSMKSFKLLQRVLKEQCNVEETSKEKAVEVSVKPSKEVPSNSLQNPSDPDAGYSGHKGQGYQVQVMETYNREEEEGEDRSKKLNLITHVKVEPAHESDANALLPAIESTKERDLTPKEVLADSLYGSDENCEAAKAMGVEIISPTMGALSNKEDTITLSDFELSETGKISKCPEGQTPLKTKNKKERHVVVFNSDVCSNCHKTTQCPVKQGKKNHYLRYTDKQLRIAKRRQKEQEPEFKERYRYRAGIEATMSLYDTLTSVKQLRVRGVRAVRFCTTLKAIGVNIFRATAVRNAENCSNPAIEGKTSVIGHIIFVFKEQYEKVSTKLQQILGYLNPDYNLELKLTA